MKRCAAVLLFLFSCGAFSAASAQEFPGLDAALGAIQAQAQAQKQEPQRPKVMGSERFAAAAAVLAPPAPDVTAYPVRGIDVSHYEGAIAWDQLATAGLSFIVIKATEGETVTDQNFAANWQGATSAGLIKGAYHFYDFCDPGAPQADKFIKTVPVEAGTLPPTIDLEQSVDCSTMPARGAFRADLAAFVQKLENAYGTAPILYVNYAIYKAYFLGEDDPYKLWIADVSGAAPAMPGGAGWSIWQYGWHGRVAGISGEVDLDAFNGTPEDLASLAGRDPGVPLASAQ